MMNGRKSTINATAVLVAIGHSKRKRFHKRACLNVSMTYVFTRKGVCLHIYADKQTMIL
jgi:hypothetical protein